METTEAVRDEKVAAAKAVDIKAIPFNGLEPLDFSEFTSTDSPELAAFKANVVRVAKKYARAHDWCSVVDNALKEMGAVPVEETVEVKVGTTFLEMVVKVKPEDYAGLSARRQVAKIVSQIGPLALVGSGPVRGSMTIKPEAVVSMEIVTKAKPPVSEGVPADDETYRFRYTSDTARVVHAFRRDATDDIAGNLRLAGPVRTVCNTATNLRNLIVGSSRGEDRVCERCAVEVRRGQARARAPF